MKEETKRYALVEYNGIRERIYDTLEEYNQLLKEIEKYNNRKTSKAYCGNVSWIKQEDGKYKVTFHMYNKLTEKLTITELDNFTMNFENEKALANAFKDKLKTYDGFRPDINILYFEDKNKKDKTPEDFDRRIKYIDILYSTDRNNINKQYIENVLYQEAKNKNITFFKELLNQFCFNPIVGIEIEKIRYYIDKCEVEANDSVNANNYAAIFHISKELFRKLIRGRDNRKYIDRDHSQSETTSRRRLRDFYIFTRNYDVPYEFRKSPIKYRYISDLESKKILKR